MNANTNKKYAKLLERLRNEERLMVAFSGGVDSTLLLKAAKTALGEKVIAVTASCEAFTDRELELAKQFCLEEGIQLRTVRVEQLKIDGFADNPPDRCYICKRAIFEEIIWLASENGISTVAEGTNADDADDYRPGMKAIEELGIISPLKEAGLTKDEIREISRDLGLSTYNKPATPCLATRIPTGEPITPDKLEMIEKGERFLSDLGFHQIRVRIHGDDLARIEVMPDEFSKLLSCRQTVTNQLKSAGFRYVSMDLCGYTMGSTNR